MEVAGKAKEIPKVWNYVKRKTVEKNFVLMMLTTQRE